jgi:hypothetical protein
MSIKRQHQLVSKFRAEMNKRLETIFEEETLKRAATMNIIAPVPDDFRLVNDVASVIVDSISLGETDKARSLTA